MTHVFECVAPVQQGPLQACGGGRAGGCRDGAIPAASGTGLTSPPSFLCSQSPKSLLPCLNTGGRGPAARGLFILDPSHHQAGGGMGNGQQGEHKAAHQRQEIRI